jgi:hypothetical protein
MIEKYLKGFISLEIFLYYCNGIKEKDEKKIPLTGKKY